MRGRSCIQECHFNWASSLQACNCIYITTIYIGSSFVFFVRYIFYKGGPLYMYHISRPQSLEVSWISESPPSTQMHVNSCHALWYFFFYILSHAFSVCNYAQLTTLNHHEFLKILPQFFLCLPALFGTFCRNF